MTVGNPEGFKIQLKTGREEVDTRVPCDFTNLTLKKLFLWIDDQQVAANLKSELKKSASRFPHQALTMWQRDFEKHLSKAQVRIRKKKDSLVSIAEPLEEKKINQITKDSMKMKASDFDDFDDYMTEELNDTEVDEIAVVEESTHNSLENTEIDSIEVSIAGVSVEPVEPSALNESPIDSLTVEISTIETPVEAILEESLIESLQADLTHDGLSQDQSNFNDCKENDI